MMITISIPALPSFMALIAVIAFGWGFVSTDELPFVGIGQAIAGVFVFFATYGMCSMV